MAHATPRLPLSRTLRDASRTPAGSILVRASVVVAIFLALHGIDALTFDGQILHIDEEQNLPTWARTLLFAFAGAVWVGRARLGDRDRGLCLSVGVLLILFSIDDTVMGHEYLEAQSENASALIKIWEPLAGLIVAAIFVQAARRLGGTQRWLFVAAAGSLLVGQAASAANDDSGGAVTVALSTIEQVGETYFGIFLLAAGLPTAWAQLTAYAARTADARPAPDRSGRSQTRRRGLRSRG